MEELIKHAAIKTSDGEIVTGKSHAHAYEKALPKKFGTSPGDQGFVTNTGRYVGREEGGKIALASGQIVKETNFLFSEDLWDIGYEGIHDYSEAEGYYINEEKKELFRGKA